MNAILLATLCAVLVSCDAAPQTPPAAPEIYAPIIQEAPPAPEPRKRTTTPEIKPEKVQQSVDRAWSTTIQYQRKLKDGGK